MSKIFPFIVVLFTALGGCSLAVELDKSTAAQQQSEAPSWPSVKGFALSEELCTVDGDFASPGLLGQHNNIRFLSDRTPIEQSNGWGPIELDSSNGGKAAGDGVPMVIGRHPISRGLGVHAPSRIVYAVPKNCAYFSAQVGLDQEVGDKGSVRFKVLVDGKEKFNSGVIRGSRTVRHVALMLTGASTIELLAEDGGDGSEHDHANWGDAYFSCPPREPAVTDLLDELSVEFKQSSWINLALWAKDVPKARKMLADHLRQGGLANYYPDYQGAQPAPDSAHKTHQADNILAHRFPVSPNIFAKPLQLPASIDWTNLGVSGQSANVLHRHGWVNLLADAYWYTSDEAYLKKCIELLRDWRKQLPPPIVAGTELYPPYNAMSVAMRALALVNAIFRFRQSSALSDADLRFLFALVVEQGNLLQELRTIGNYGTEIHLALATIGISFPELTRAEGWKKYGLCRLERESRYDILADGMHFELSPGYHMNIVTRFSRIERLAERNGISMSPAFLKQLERAYEAMVTLARPNKDMPQINDTRSNGYHRPWLPYGAVRFNRPDFKYAGNGQIDWVASQVGGLSDAERKLYNDLPVTAPNYLSRYMPEAGLVTMRSGWAPESLYMLFDLGHEGGPHTHRAHMNVDVYGLGRSFIVDPGCGSYDHESVDYFKSPEAHNVVAIDGNARSSALQGFLWHSNEVADAVVGAVDIDGHRWLRAVVFVKPDYWVVVDTIVAGGVVPKTVEQLWHYVPGEVDLKSQAVNISHPANPFAPRMLMKWATSENVAFESRPGYLTIGVNGKEPVGPGDAAVADYFAASVAPTKPMTIVPTLLYPQAAGDQTEPEFDAAEIEGGILLNVKRGTETDVIVFAYAPPLTLYGLGTVDGWLGVYRTKNGQVESSLVVK